jgi:Transposase DDE domain
MDGSVAGRGCMALRLHVVYKGRALPLAWRVRQGPKGPFPDDLHSALVEVGSGLRPEGAQVVFLGDGAWDGTRLPHTGQDAGWASVGRTGGPRTAWWDGETLRLATLGACSQPGTLVAFSEVGLTRAHYGPIMLSGCWAKGGKAPLYVVTNRDAAEEACRLYSKRCRIETFFSEQKSRGCHLHQSPLSDPQRLSRLFIAACFAYSWIVYLGSVCRKEGGGRIIHRRHRCD